MSHEERPPHAGELANPSTLLLHDASTSEGDSKLPLYIARMLEGGASRADFAQLANALGFLATSALRAEQRAAGDGGDTPALVQVARMQRAAVMGLVSDAE